MAASPSARISRYQGDLHDPDTATAQTIELMCEFITRTAQDPMVQAAARDAVNRFRGGPLYACAGINPWTSPAAQAESVWFWVKHALKFVHHDGLIQVWLNEHDQLQLLIAPDLLLRMRTPRGDCAIYTMLECAMLQALELPYEIVTAAVTPGSAVFDHVWARCVLPSGKRLNLDASHGKYPGWQVPFEHRTRTQVWDEQGNPLEDAAPRPLGQFQARPNQPILPKRLALLPGITVRDYQRFQRGLGLVQRLGVRWPGLSGGLGQSAADSIAMAEQADYATLPTSTPVSVTTPSGFNWQGTIGNLLNQWTQIAGNVIAPRNTITTGPQGTSVNLAAGSQLPAGALLAPGAAGFTGILPWLVGGAVVFFLIKAASK